MSSGRGRQLVYSLLSELTKDICPDDHEIAVLNLGGGSKKEVQIRNVYLNLLHPGKSSCKLTSSEETSSTVDLPECRRSGSDHHHRRRKKRKQYDTDESDNDETQFVSKNLIMKKSFIPDVVCEAFVKNVKPVQSVVLTVSVKSNMGPLGLQNEKALNELKYEMTPVVMKQKQALGLVICAAEAILVRMVFKEEKIPKQIVVFHSDNYQFVSEDDKKFNFPAFDKMCRDIIHYGKLMMQ